MKGRKPKLALVASTDKPLKTPPPPDWLTKQAKAAWQRAAPELQARNLLTDDVKAMLESYCIAVGQVKETEEIMARDGRLIDVDGVAKPHPAFKIQSAAMREARLLAAELGLTPHRRGITGKNENDNPDQWDNDLLA